jgi:enoyl-CoA hydratase/carnithine racemase
MHERSKRFPCLSYYLIVTYCIYPFQVHFGAAWPLSLAAILRAKVGDHRIHRKIALEGYRFTPKEALEAGLLDHIVNGNTADIIAKAEEVAHGVSANAKEGVWGLIKVLGVLNVWLTVTEI